MKTQTGGLKVKSGIKGGKIASNHNRLLVALPPTP